MIKFEMGLRSLKKVGEALSAFGRGCRTRLKLVYEGVQELAPTAISKLQSDVSTKVWGRANSQRYAAASLVVLLHVAVLWALATSLRVVRIGDQVSDMEVTLVSPSLGHMQPVPTEMSAVLIAPQAILVPEPEIKIAEAIRSPGSIATIDMSHLLPPRPDPSHVNFPPPLPIQFTALGASASAVLRIFVQPDGSISDAQITRSSGSRMLDEIAVVYVKEKWRFIAALASGRSVPDWTTVLVPFRAS